MKRYLLMALLVSISTWTFAQVNYTANDQVTPYQGYFHPGMNMGYHPPYTDIDLANLAGGNPALGLSGIGVRAMRPAFYEYIAEGWGYDLVQESFLHYESLGMNEMTCIIGFPSDEHRDQTVYCDDGETQSELFAGLYEDVWDGGANGTPYNDDNYLAAYLYKIVTLYKDHVRFWEIWNEPGFDYTWNTGWRPPGDPAGNWWDNDPDPCDYKLHAPVQHFVRTLRVSYDVIKTVDPDAYVTLAGVGFESFLDAVLRNTDNPVDGSVTAEYPRGGGAYFDVMGFHTYPDIDGSVRQWDTNLNQWVYKRHSDAAALGVPRRKNIYQGILSNYGYDGVTYPKKEWIITEINTPRRKFDTNSMASQESQTNYIVKAMVQSMKNDIRQMHPYQLIDRATNSSAGTEFDLLGMYKNIDGTDPYVAVEKNEEAIPYKTTANFVFKSRYDADKTAAMNLPDEIDGIALYDVANDRYKYILWAVTTIDKSEAAAATYSFPASFNLSEIEKRNWDYSETGATSMISPNDIALTGRPIFLMEESSIQSSLSLLTCPTDTVITGTAEEVTLIWELPTAETTCPTEDLYFTQTSGPILGTTTQWTNGGTVSYEVTDDCGNFATCSFYVQGFLADPEINLTCPDDILIELSSPDSLGAIVSWNEADIDFGSNCGTPVLSQIAGQESGSYFGLGSSTIQYLVFSPCNNNTLSSTCSFDVIVTNPSTAPSLQLSCPSDIKVEIPSDDNGAIITWNEDEIVATVVNCNPATVSQITGPVSGSMFSVGITEVQYLAVTSCPGVSNPLQDVCSFDVTITKLVGIEDLDEITKIQLSPNPAQNEVRLIVQAEGQQDMDVELYDNLGRVLLTKSFPFHSGELNTTLDVNHLSNGSYFVKVSTQKEVGIRKLTISK